MSSTATLRAHGFLFGLSFEGLERIAGAESETDNAQWVSGVVELELSGFQARQRVSVRVDELERFAHGLAALNRALTGQAELTHLEGCFGLAVDMTTGRGTLSGFVASDHDGTRLTFDSVPIDQSFLAAPLRDLTAAMRAFRPGP